MYVPPHHTPGHGEKSHRVHGEGGERGHRVHREGGEREGVRMTKRKQRLSTDREEEEEEEDRGLSYPHFSSGTSSRYIHVYTYTLP